MLCVVLYSGIALGAAGTSTSFASMTFHFTPKAVAPATVIRSTTLCEGGSEGGMIGGGDGIGCANEPKMIYTEPTYTERADTEIATSTNGRETDWSGWERWLQGHLKRRSILRSDTHRMRTLLGNRGVVDHHHGIAVADEPVRLNKHTIVGVQDAPPSRVLGQKQKLQGYP